MAKKAITAAVKNNEVSFSNMLSAAKLEVRTAEAAVRTAEGILTAAKSLAATNSCKLNELKRIGNMSIYEGDAIPFLWHVRTSEGSFYQKTAWSEVHEYKTMAYDFTATIKERTDLKKMKWEIHLHGTKTTMADNSHSSSYRDSSYIADKYSALDLTQKYNSEAAARVELERLKVMLVNDHKEEIAAEKVLSLLAKAMPRIKVGSIVEHAVRSFYGTGIVISNIYSDQWEVKFDKPELKDTVHCYEESLILIKE